MIEFRHGKESNIDNIDDVDGIIVTSDTNKLFVLVNGTRYQISDAIKTTSGADSSSLIEGKLYFETDTKKLFYFDGTEKVYTGNSSGSTGGGSSITVDGALSSTSTNPVQNKVIKAALDGKVDKVDGKGLSTNDYTTEEKEKLSGLKNTVVDSTLSSTSTNAIQNKAVKSAIDELKASIGSGSSGTVVSGTNYNDVNPLLETKNMFAISDSTSDVVNFNGRGGTLTSDDHKIIIFRVHIGNNASSFLMIAKTRSELIYSVLDDSSGLNVKEMTSPAGNTLFTATLAIPYTSTNKFDVQYGENCTATINGVENEFISAIQCNAREDIPKFILDMADFILYDNAESNLFPSGWYPEKDKLNNTVGDISGLKTTAKDSIVEAINELSDGKANVKESRDVTFQNLYIKPIVGHISFDSDNYRNMCIYRSSVAGGSKLNIQCNNEFCVRAASKEIINYVVTSGSNTGLTIGNREDELMLNGSDIILRGAYSSGKYRTSVTVIGDSAIVDIATANSKFGVRDSSYYGIVITPEEIQYSGSSDYTLMKFNTTGKYISIDTSMECTNSVGITGYCALSEIDANSNSTIPFYATSDASAIRYDNTKHEMYLLTRYSESTNTYDAGVRLHSTNGTGDTTYFGPATDNAIQLGCPSYRWSDIFSGSSTIQTSDRNAKNTIQDIDEETAVLLVEGLKPSTFKMNDSTSDRTHYGFIAQDVEETVNSLGIETKDFACICKDRNMKDVEVVEKVPYKERNEETGEIEWKEKEETVIRPVMIPEGEEGYGYKYSLRYDELIAPIVSHAQYLYKKTEALEKENLELKETLSSVLKRLEKLENLGN